MLRAYSSAWHIVSTIKEFAVLISKHFIELTLSNRIRVLTSGGMAGDADDEGRETGQTGSSSCVRGNQEPAFLKHNITPSEKWVRRFQRLAHFTNVYGRLILGPRKENETLFFPSFPFGPLFPGLT